MRLNEAMERLKKHVAQDELLYSHEKTLICQVIDNFQAEEERKIHETYEAKKLLLRKNDKQAAVRKLFRAKPLNLKELGDDKE
ncbi:hypothetical protein [Tautonia plasticadhaerens]|uniref:Uncharacterized protein n=1 Tax=Tautonia plasticadhaerens TaxID=2527974 RepID=A0A518H289_9BACT|nr:hypothetical protein [Tautonia plasticadhaerens]QDV34944.1 hypothetical protein ElP_28410 [Tautonia plasticadhaerens]